MNETFADLLDTFVIIYLDDILIFSPDMTTHEEHLATVLQRLRDNHLYANTEKTTLVVSEVDFLGHHVCRGQITPDADKVQAITTWPPPTCLKEVQSFLGLINFYR